MAKILPIHGEMSGSIAGNVYSHNKGGSYVRRKTIPTNPGTVRQQTVRGRLADFAQRWGQLTSDQRQGWNDYAATHPIIDRQGSSMNISGESMFVRLNAQASVAGWPAVDDAPGFLTPHATELASIVVTAINATTATVAFTSSPCSANEKLELLLGPAQGPGQNKGLGSARHASTSAISASSPVTMTLSPVMTPGAYHNIWVRSIGDDGSASVPQKATVLCP